MAQKDTRPVGQIACEIGRLLVSAGQGLIRYSPTPESIQEALDLVLAAAEKFGDLPEYIFPELDCAEPGVDEPTPDVEGK
jgi:hypothetical protein